jgi:hypothetical protein
MEVDPIQLTPTTLDHSGTPQQVQWCEANEAQRTLGSCIAPDGNFYRQLEVLHDKLTAWKQCLRNLNSSNLQAKWLSYQTVFMKKIMYPLIGHCCGYGDLQEIQKPVDRELLHLLGLNEHFPRAVLHAPLKYGGLGSVTIHGQHVIEKLILLVHHMRENGQIRETMLSSMGTTQLECGSGQPFFTLPADTWYQLVTSTWITHIWKECQPTGIDIKFHPEIFWVPKPVRENDVCIMDVVSTMYEGEQLRRINMCRIKLQVTFISDIAAVDGTRILLGYYDGKRHQESGRRSRLNWPPVGELPQSWWQLWREFLIRWCGSALRLQKPLGRWFANAEMLTQCCFFLHGRRLIMQHKEACFEFRPINSRARTRFEPRAYPFDEVHLLAEALVVDVTYKHKCIYVIAQSAQLVMPDIGAQAPKSLEDLFCHLPPELQRTIGSVTWPDHHALIDIIQSVQEGTLIGVSDGSARIRDAKATHAWVIQAQNGSEIWGHGPVDGVTEARTIHRAELQGQTAILLMLSLIVQLAGIIGGKIATFCDNQAVVKKMQRGWSIWRYRNTKGADSDLQAQLRNVLAELKGAEFTYATEWVQGHQDEKGPAQSYPKQVALNIRMDDETKTAYNLPGQWITQQFIPVFKAEGCAVYIGGQKITSNLQLNLRERWHEDEAKAYLSRRHNFTPEMFETVSWQALRYSLTKLSPHRRATAVKAIHRHLPTQEKLFTQGRVTLSSLCPRCLAEEESNAHVFCCTHLASVTQRKADWRELWKSLHQHRTATVIEQTWRYYLQSLIAIPLGNSIIEGLPIAHGEVAVLLQQAVEEQSAIGWEKLLLGIGSTKWKMIQEVIDNGHPKPPQRSATAWMNAAMHQLLKFSLRCWKYRNECVHGSTRQEQKQIALTKVREQIKSIYADPPPLAPRFQSIYAIPLDHRLKMTLQTAEQWVSLIAHQARVTQHNFKILLSQHKPMHTHLRTMRKEARNQMKERRLPETPRKARSRAIQLANAKMREKLYCKPAKITKHKTRKKLPCKRHSKRHTGSTSDMPGPPMRRHPP